MTRLALTFALALPLFAFAGCKKDSSHSHGDDEHSHSDGDESHDSPAKKSADPATKEVPMPTAAAANKVDSAETTPSPDTSTEDKPATETIEQETGHDSDNDGHSHNGKKHPH